MKSRRQSLKYMGRALYAWPGVSHFPHILSVKKKELLHFVIICMRQNVFMISLDWMTNRPDTSGHIARNRASIVNFHPHKFPKYSHNFCFIYNQ